MPRLVADCCIDFSGLNYETEELFHFEHCLMANKSSGWLKRTFGSTWCNCQCHDIESSLLEEKAND